MNRWIRTDERGTFPTKDLPGPMDAIDVSIADQQLTATWLETNPRTRKTIEAALPIAGDAARWGDELYLQIDPKIEPEETVRTVERGTVAYWPAGPAICLFWGPTPASEGSAPVAASPVAPVAMLDDPSPLDQLRGGAHISLKLRD